MGSGGALGSQIHNLGGTVMKWGMVFFSQWCISTLRSTKLIRGKNTGANKEAVDDIRHIHQIFLSVLA